METSRKKHVTFHIVWGDVSTGVREDVTRIWKEHTQFSPSEIDARLSQLVAVMKSEQGRVVGVSTARKTYIHQLRNYLFACRVLIVPEYRRENLAPSLLVFTRDFLETVPQPDAQDPAIGLITSWKTIMFGEHERMQSGLPQKWYTSEIASKDIRSGSIISKGRASFPDFRLSSLNRYMKMIQSADCEVVVPREFLCFQCDARVSLEKARNR